MKTVTEIYQEIYPVLEEMEQKRVDFLGQRKKILLVGIAMIVLIIFIGLFTLNQTGDFSQVFLILIVVTVIACVGYYNYQKRKVVNAYKSEVIPKIIESVDSSYHYDAKRHIEEYDFKASQLFRKPDRYSGEDFISGRLGKTDFKLSEVHAEYETRDKDGDSSYHTIFKGLFMIADFHKDFQGHTVVVPDKGGEGWLGRIVKRSSRKGKQIAKMENADFEKYFDVYTTDQVEARYILSMSMIENIIMLKEMFKSKIHIAFLNSCIYIAIDWKLNILEPKLNRTLLDEATIHHFLDEIWLCLEIIEDLDLNTRIWSKT